MSTAPKDQRMVVQLTLEELVGVLEPFIRAAVREEVQRLCEPRFLTIADVCLMLDISSKYLLRKLVAEQGLPVARMFGREPRFERDAVVAWMRQGGASPPEPERPRLKRRGHLERVK